MLAAEMAVEEIRWWLTQFYSQQEKDAIKELAIALAAKEFEIRRNSLRKYCERSPGEPHRWGPRPDIDFDELIDDA
jgi:hypothetical protein